MAGNQGKNTISAFFSNADEVAAGASDCRYLCLTGKADDHEVPELNRLIFTTEENYSGSFCDPGATVPVFGVENGLLLAAFRYRLENAVSFSFTGSRERFTSLKNSLESVYRLNSDEIRTILREDFLREQADEIKQITGHPFILETWDKGCLYRTGTAVTENDRAFFSHVLNLDRHTKNRITEAIAGGYVKSFSDDGKSLHGLKTVSVSMSPGYLALMPGLASRFEENGLKLNIRGFSSTGESLQAKHDHRFDWALFLNGETVERALGEIEKTLIENREYVEIHSGSVYLMTFGARHPEPEKKEFIPTPDAEQNGLYRNFVLRKQEMVEKYIKKSRTSYTGIAFPLPDTGPGFKKLFEDMVEVNTLDLDLYENIQNTIIEALDRAESVHIKGLGNNETDISIAMHPLEDTSRETNFLNCLSTVNIPLGEVFTTPLLQGTTGILHIEEAFLEGILFRNLKLRFTDGYITDYSCSNTSSMEESKQLVYSSLIHPHKTLPVGEFAIGTNTAAYRMAKHHGILNILPVLVAEKMGPHIAIGDTCFRGREDLPCYNSNRKEMTARSNEKTSLRETDKENAYTATHKDITLPYESIEKLAAVNPGGEETDIIREGRFVLRGTEHLNSYLD